jgi:hypothetical protein
MRPWIAVVTLVPLVSRAATSQTPTDSALAGITARGRLLAQHDAASWQATDALQALTKDLSGLNVSVALRDSAGRWIVRFGRLATSQDTFFVMFTAEPAADGRHYEARRHSPPVIGGDRERLIATAILTALKEFGAPTRPYNSYGLPADDGGVWVYFVPAQTDSRIYPHGGDIRYHLAANGQRILDQNRFHRATLEFPAPADSAVAGIHTSFDSLPADTDVLYVLLRRPQKPEIIVTERFVFRIAPDGSITWRTKDGR